MLLCTQGYQPPMRGGSAWPSRGFVASRGAAGPWAPTDGGGRWASSVSAALPLTTSLTVNVILSDLPPVSFVVPALLLGLLHRGWWLGPAVCTASQATNTATMFCTFYRMIDSLCTCVSRGHDVAPCGPPSQPTCLPAALWGYMGTGFGHLDA